MVFPGFGGFAKRPIPPPTLKFPGVCFFMKKFFLAALVSIPMASGFLTVTASAQKWADLTMTVVLDGAVPERKAINMAADPKCNNKNPLSDDLIIDPKTKAISNIVFMIDTKKNKLDNSKLHPDLQKLPDTKPVLDNVLCKFEPHVMAIRAGQKIEVKNSDEAGHNAKFGFFANKEVNPMIAAGKSVDVETKEEEKAATKVECSIHPWMNAYVFILNHPYIGISGSDGVIKIEKLPAGVELDFKIWHESQNKSIEEVNLGGKAATWTKGTVKLTLKEGANDLGTLLLKPDRFKAK